MNIPKFKDVNTIDELLNSPVLFHTSVNIILILEYCFLITFGIFVTQVHQNEKAYSKNISTHCGTRLKVGSAVCKSYRYCMLQSRKFFVTFIAITKLKLPLHIINFVSWGLNSVGHILTTLHTPKKNFVLLIDSSKVSFFRADLMGRGFRETILPPRAPEGPLRAPKGPQVRIWELGDLGAFGGKFWTFVIKRIMDIYEFLDYLALYRLWLYQFLIRQP